MAQQEKITSKLTTVPDLEVIKTKELKDFVGNKFILTELSPKGYMIYHPHLEFLWNTLLVLPLLT